MAHTHILHLATDLVTVTTDIFGHKHINITVSKVMAMGKTIAETVPI